MGLTDTEHTVLREISDPGGKAKQVYTANFILRSLAGLIKSRKLKEMGEMKNSTQLLSKMLKLVPCPLEHKIQLNIISKFCVLTSLLSETCDLL